MNKKNDESKELLKQINAKKYSNDNGYFPGFPTLQPTTTLFDNYFEFLKASKSFQIYIKINKILKKIKKNRNNDDEIVLINKEIDNIEKGYKKIMKEAKNNYRFYKRVIMNLYWDYQSNYWKNGIGKIFDKTTTGILSLLNENYIDYEKKLEDFSCKLKELNLKLTNNL